MTDLEPSQPAPGEDIDYTSLYTAAGVFLDAYCTATNTDRGRLDRQVLTVDLTDAEGRAPSLTLDLGVESRPGALFDSAAADAAKASIESAASDPSTEETA